MKDQERDDAAAAGLQKPTLKTLAELTGLAVTTVSRALAEDPKIAAATRKRVAEAARKVGYVPDRAAQRLRTGRTNVISLVLDPHNEILDFSASMIAGIGDVLEGTDFHLTLTQYRLGTDGMVEIRNIVRNRLADGIIFARTKPQDARVGFLNDAGFPFITFGRTHLGPHPWLDYDNTRFAELAVEKLAAKGRKRIALIAPPPEFTFQGYMLQGFNDAVARAGVTGLVSGSIDINADRAILARQIAAYARDKAPDGWVCPGEVSAIALMSALMDAGLRIGRDVDLVAKKTSGVLDLLRPQVDTISEDLRASGQGLAELLLARLRGAPVEDLHKLQPPTE